MSERLRLRDVDPERLAAQLAESARLVKERQLSHPTPLQGALEILKRYAQGEPYFSQATIEARVETIRALYQSPVDPGAAVVLKREPGPLSVLMAAVFARQALDRGRALTTNELAILVGLAPDHIAVLAADGSIPSASRAPHSEDKRRPWRFRATKALKKWIEERNA